MTVQVGMAWDVALLDPGVNEKKMECEFRDEENDIYVTSSN